MDKKLILSVAGSGKTKFIIDKLCEEERSLIITYTNNNISNINKRIRTKFGYLPESIRVLEYYEFLYTFCYLPLLNFEYKAKGIDWNPCPNLYAVGDTRFINNNHQLYSNRLAKLLQNKCLPDVKERIAKYFHNFFVDEVQDFAGNDFNFLLSLNDSKLNMYLIGDFYQHTFDTSKDGRAGGEIYDCINKYKEKFKRKYDIDTERLKKSYRCSPTVCKFISDSMNIDIQSARQDSTEIIFIEELQEAKRIVLDNKIIKLFNKDSKKQNCYAENWGNSKGLDCFNDVCVILTDDTEKCWNKNKNFLSIQSKETRNKLYVACSRSKGNLYFLTRKLYKKSIK